MLPGRWHVTRSAGSVFAFAVVFLALIMCGFLVGHTDRAGRTRRGEDERIVEDGTSPQKQPLSQLPLQSASKRSSLAVPVDFKNLSGKEFVEALPALEALAHRGDMDATRLLIRGLGSCGSYRAASDEDIRDREESKYQRELDMLKLWRAKENGRPVDPGFNEESIAREHDAALKSAFDERDLCTSLTPQQMDSRFDWIRIALERHDRQMILDAALAGVGIGTGGIERVRNAEKLEEIARLERSELDALIATGDVTALERAAYAFGGGWNSILQYDATLAYTYAYAWTLTQTPVDTWQQHAMPELMQNLSAGKGQRAPLTPAQIDAARAQGLALFQRCCSNGVRH